MNLADMSLRPPPGGPIAPTNIYVQSDKQFTLYLGECRSGVSSGKSSLHEVTELIFCSHVFFPPLLPLPVSRPFSFPPLKEGPLNPAKRFGVTNQFFCPF